MVKFRFVRCEVNPTKTPFNFSLICMSCYLELCFSQISSADLQSCNPSEEEAEKWFNQYQVKTSASWAGLSVLHLKQGAS